MVSVDRPFEDVDEAAARFDKAEIGEADRIRIGRENAIGLFKLKLGADLPRMHRSTISAFTRVRAF